EPPSGAFGPPHAYGVGTPKGAGRSRNQKLRVGDFPRPSTVYVRSATASDSRSRTRFRSPRGLRPPELPAGKRGGWHHDSVYPKLRLTSFAPRALNFDGNTTRINFSLDASSLRRRVRSLGGDA